MTVYLNRLSFIRPIFPSLFVEPYNAPGILIRLFDARAHEANAAQFHAVPFIFSGLKVAIALAVVGAVVGEFVNADKGLGYMIITATAFFKTPVAFGSLILLSIMGVVLFQIVVIIERIFFPWSAANQETTIA